MTNNSVVAALLALLSWYQRLEDSDCTAALEALRRGAESGDASFQNTLADASCNGVCVQQSQMGATAWYRRAAIQGLMSAQYGLASWMRRARACRRTVRRPRRGSARRLTRVAGLPAYWLGWMYEREQGLSMNLRRAAAWYLNAAEQGLATAQANLGALQAAGSGEPKDPVQTAVWYRKAAEQGHARAPYLVGVALASGEGVAKGAHEVVAWCCRSAEQGRAGAQFKLALASANGDGVEKNPRKAGA